MNISPANWLLDSIYEEAHMRINPSGDDCWNCGGESYTYDCIDGFCENAEDGCEDCAQPCIECKIYDHNVRRAVIVEVLRTADVDLAIAFLKRINEWSPKITREDVLANIHAGIVASRSFSADERAASACWVEGLL